MEVEVVPDLLDSDEWTDRCEAVNVGWFTMGRIPTDGLAPCEAVDVGGFPMDRIIVSMVQLGSLTELNSGVTTWFIRLIAQLGGSKPYNNQQSNLMVVGKISWLDRQSQL